MKKLTILMTVALSLLSGSAQASVKCSGTPCIDSAGGVSESTTPVTWTGVHTFNNAPNTPVTMSDGVIDSTLTATRVTFAGASGRLSDDADLTFATDTLTATKAVGSTSVCAAGAVDAANSVCVSSNAVTGEGATADANETVLAFGDASADNTLTLKGTASGVEATVTTGALLTGAGTGTGRVSVGGILCQAAPGTTTAGTTEEVLATCPIPANTLASNGDFLRVRFFMTTAATANNRTVFVRIGASGTCTPGTCQIVYQSLTAQPNAQRVYFLTPLIITRQSSTTATAEAYLAYSPDATPTSGTTSYGTYLDDNASVTWGNALDLVISVTTATAAGGLTLSNYSVEVVQ